MRPFLVNHLYSHAHGLGDDEDIRENDCSIQETFIALHRLKGECAGYFGITAALEEVSISFRFMILGEVTSSYTESARNQISIPWCTWDLP